MSGQPIILPAAHPLPHQREIEFPAWCADKLREAFALGPAETREADGIERLLLLALLRDWPDAPLPEDPWEPGPPCAACGQTTCDHPDPVFAGLIPPPPRVARPNYAALGLGSAEEAEGRN